MSDLSEIKSLIDKGNETAMTAITALREQVDSLGKKSGEADVLYKEKLGKIETDIADAMRQVGEAEAKGKALTAKLDLLEEIGAGGKKASTAFTQDALDHKTAFESWLRNPHQPGVLGELQTIQKKAADVRGIVGASGGFAVPEVISANVEKQLIDTSGIRGISRVISTGTPDYVELLDANNSGFDWVGETGTRSQTTTPDLIEVKPPLGTVHAYSFSTREALQDLIFDVAAWLTQSSVEKFLQAEGAAFVAGDGANKPRGFLNGTPVATGDDTRAAGVLQFVPSGAAATFGADPIDQLVDLVYTLKAGYRTGANWVMNSATMAALFKVKTVDGAYILQPSMARGLPSTLLGYPVVPAEDMPDIAADALPIAFGDFRRGYLIVDRAGLYVIQDEVTTPGFVKWQMGRRVGGSVKDSNAIKLLKISVN